MIAPGATRRQDSGRSDIPEVILNDVGGLLAEEHDPEQLARHLTRLVEEPLRKTVEYWRRWLSKCTYKERWREMVERSALALKLLTFEPSGAIVAAPTCFFR